MRNALATVVLLAAATGCRNTPTSVVVDPGLLTLVPENVTALGGLRVKAARDTATWKQLLLQPAFNRAMDRFVEYTSFDPRKDLWEVMWSIDAEDTLVYARGEFAPMGLEPKLERKGVQRMSYKNSMLLGDERSAVLFLNSSTAIYGPTPRLRRLIDERDTKKEPRIRTRLSAIPHGSHAWFVMEAAALPRLNASGDGADRSVVGGVGGNLLQNLPKLLAAVDYLIAHANLADGVAIQATTWCKDDSGARQVSDSLKGALGIARFAMPKEQRDLLPILDAIQVEQQNKEARLNMRLTTEQYTQLLAMLSPGTKPRPKGE